MINNQKQQSGDNSTQIMAQNLILGIDEKRAREIYDEKYEIAKSQFTREAIEIANLRINEFEEKLMEKMKQINGALQSFGDPSTQVLLIEAQKSAAQSDRTSDYELLADLLAQKHLNNANRETVSGISRAVKIVHEISDEALQALTAIHLIETVTPLNGDHTLGLDLYETIFSKIIVCSFPVGVEWIEHSELLGVLRINPFASGLTPLNELFKQKFDGYICAGIKANSESHTKALALLSTHGIPHGLLVHNSLAPGFVRLNVSSKSNLKEIKLIQMTYGGQILTPLNESQLGALNEIFTLYTNESESLERSLSAFTIEWEKRPTLKQILIWWPNIDISFSSTRVGKVLAHANAQRCEHLIPNLPK